jgi:hypothetical protein
MGTIHMRRSWSSFWCVENAPLLAKAIDAIASRTSTAKIERPTHHILRVS